MVKLDHRISRGTADIAFADTGGFGPAVVLTHGAGLDHSMFEEQAAALSAAGFRVIMWDLPGHGQSTISGGTRFTASAALADLDALLVECDVDPPVLVGHSLGGNLAQAFAKDSPDRVRGLIIVDATWNTGPLTGFERFALQLAAPALTLIPSRTLPGQMARASAVSASAIARARGVFARMPKSRFVDVWRATVSLVDPDPDYRSPVALALVRGAADRTGNIATAMTRWAAAEGIDAHVIPDAGHIVTWDAPAATSSALLTVLADWDLTPNREGGPQ
ncbi:alpha/beta fold hydrolase [Microbacterium sp. ZW CA_36]|uniref:alpha/beta fold hydrolase n=1 Tax=Microbacterium sp. ZW CA_36 TaxID=3378078 RepID=UPI003853A8F4